MLVAGLKLKGQPKRGTEKGTGKETNVKKKNPKIGEKGEKNER